MFNIKVITILSIIFLSSSAISFEKPLTEIPLYKKSAQTYYIKAQIGGLAATEFMLDTGSGYNTINEETLAKLKANGSATYIKDIVGILADGSLKTVPVWSLSQFNIGGVCILNNVEAAVFPNKTRQILGLSALKQTAPFTVSFDPAKIVLSHCTS